MSTMEEMGPSALWRIAGVAEPGDGKSGAIASVINTGRYNLRVMDLDGNTRPLFAFIRREFWKKVDIVPVSEKLFLPGADDVMPPGSKTPDGQDVSGKPRPLDASNPMTPRAVGYPKVWRRIWQLLDDWPVYGPVSTWGPDTILMIDSATPIVAAVERKVRHLSGKGIGEGDFKDQQAMNTQFMDLFDRLKSPISTPCHLYVTFHRKLMSPQTIEETKTHKLPELNKEVLQAKAELQETRWYPNSPGRAVPPVIGGCFDTLIGFEAIYSGIFQGRQATEDNPIRLIRTVPAREMAGIKVPAPGLPPFLPLETGFLTIVEAFERSLTEGVQPNE